jgi:hypothetical protein
MNCKPINFNIVDRYVTKFILFIDRKYFYKNDITFAHTVYEGCLIFCFSFVIKSFY